MKVKFENLSKRSSGLTLIEVLAASAILSMVLVGMVTARSGLVRQMNVAQEKTKYLEEIEKQFQRWWRQPGSIPRNTEGEIKDTMIRYISESRPSELKDQGMEVVVIKFIDPKDELITQVELLLEGGNG